MAPSQHDRVRMGTMAQPLIEALKTHKFPDLTQPNPRAPPGQEIRYNRAEHLAKLRHLYPIPGPIPADVAEVEHYVTVRDGTPIRIRIYIPIKRAPPGRPLIVMMHEGGWAFGDLSDEELNCRMFARDLGALCVNVEYRLAPEVAFPIGLQDCFDVVKWCAATASPRSEVLPADPRLGFVVGGASAGGNLAAVLSQLGRDEGLSPPITGQYLCVPALLWYDVVPERWKDEYQSRFSSVDDPVLKNVAESTARSDMPLKPDTKSPLFSPLLHPNLKALPPAYFQLAGLDPLRDEGLLYERVLREENETPTRIDVYDGYGHMFWTNWPSLPRSREFVEDTLQGVKWLLVTGRKA